jgi:hypothetical protein
MTMDCASTASKARQIAEHLLALGTGEARQPAPPPVAAPPPELDYARLQRRLRWFDGLVQLYRAAAQAIADQVVVIGADDTTAGEGLDEGDRLVAVVRRVHRLLLEHPVAAKAAYAALAAEGRAYAATPAGTALREHLLQSRRVRRASLVWRALAMGMLDEADPGALPSTYLDNLIRAVDRADLEKLLGQLHLRSSLP